MAFIDCYKVLHGVLGGWHSALADEEGLWDQGYWACCGGGSQGSAGKPANYFDVALAGAAFAYISLK